MREATGDRSLDASEDEPTHEYAARPLCGKGANVSEDETVPLRLRAAAARLLGADATAVGDGELLELALAAAPPLTDLLSRWHSLHGLARAGVAGLMDSGFSLGQAMQLKAMLALGQRLVCRPLNRGEPIVTAAEVHRRLVGQLGNREQEEFHVLALDAGNRLVAHVVAAIGSTSEVGVGFGEVFRTLVREAASSVIVIHNHPSGECQPSTCDRALTVRLFEAANLLGIALLDHVIIAREEYFSFAERSEPPFGAHATRRSLKNNVPSVEEVEDETFIKRARDLFADAGTVEIDSDAVVSRGSEGAYVQAWVWVKNEDMLAPRGASDEAIRGRSTSRQG